MQFVLTHVTHDLQKRSSVVGFVQIDDPTKRLALEIPFGTGLNEIEAAAARALQDFAASVGAARIVSSAPGGSGAH
jgi:hypothetical protein